MTTPHPQEDADLIARLKARAKQIDLTFGIATERTLEWRAASRLEALSSGGGKGEDAHGEEFLEFKEALDDVRSLRAEYECLNGGGPGWAARNKAAWAKVDELFANEDEAAYDRQQEDAHG
jgi:hypothetical protein